MPSIGKEVALRLVDAGYKVVGATPRAHALAILENLHSNLRALPAMAILGSLLAEEMRHPELLHHFKTRLVEPRRALLRQALTAGASPTPPIST